jgi:uncharacterized protein involved in response to NO
MHIKPEAMPWPRAGTDPAVNQPTISINSAAAPAPQAWGVPLLRLGFRPFYLLGALFAALAIPLWAAMVLGHVSIGLAVPPLLWHAHEMLYGFAAAIVIGFLMTAGKAWTGLPTPRGPALGALAALWLAARLSALGAPYAVYALLDVALLPLIAGIFARVLLRAGNRRNLPLAGVLGGLAAANIVFHLSVLGILDVSPVRALYAALGLIVMIECVITGRVIPAFTASATPGLVIPPRPRLTVAVLATTGIALALWVFAAPALPTAIALVAAAALLVLRQWHWHPLVTRSRPILWILHVAHAWLPIGFVLLACAALGRVPASAGIHALAVGATGGLIIAMITRTARGHTGRPLQVSRLEVVAYVLVLGAAVCRVLLPLIAPQWFTHFIAGAAAAWSAAFLIYLFIYTPWLMRTRVDGKDG